MNCTAIPPKGPKSPCKVSPLFANTTRVNDPARTRWPVSSATPCCPSLFASHATPSAGWPSTPAARPVSSISELRYMIPPAQRRSISIGPIGRAQHVREPDSGTLQGFSENEGELDLDARDTVVRVRHFRAVGNHHVIQEMSVVWLADLRGGLHRLRREPDLVADEPRARLDLVLRNRGRDGVGILDGDVRVGDRELHRLLFLLLGVQQRFDAFLAFGFGQRHGFLSFRNADFTLPGIAGISGRVKPPRKDPPRPCRRRCTW